MLNEEIQPEQCQFCPTQGENANEYNILGIGCCEKCYEEYRIDPTKFEKKVISAF